LTVKEVIQIYQKELAGVPTKAVNVNHLSNCSCYSLLILWYLWCSFLIILIEIVSNSS